jgi:hypothetical protein
VALTKKYMAWLLSHNLEYNPIGSKGCEYLSQAKWPNLTHLYLSHNNIMSEEANWICKSNWTKLIYLRLCTFMIFRFQPNWE